MQEESCVNGVRCQITDFLEEVTTSRCADVTFAVVNIISVCSRRKSC